MIKKSLIALAVMIGLVVAVQAGWERASGRTTWVNRPTPATCWTRDAAGTVYPIQKINIYEDTIRHYDSGADTSSITNHPINLGFWLVDADDDSVYPNPALNGVNNTLNLSSQGNWTDVEWNIDSDGILTPKK